MRDFLLQQLSASLNSKGRYSGAEELNFCCPFCVKARGTPDRHYHFYVNPNRVKHGIKGWFYCQRCNSRGPLYKILKVKKVFPSSTRREEFRKYLRNPDVKKKEKEEETSLELPRDYVPIIAGSDAEAYLHSRGILNQTIEGYRIGMGTADLTEVDDSERGFYVGVGRIIFPDFDADGKVVFWVARTYRRHTIKYKNPLNVSARDKIYNLVGAVSFDNVIVTEGVISAIAAGENAVATYGKDVTSEQIDLLVRGNWDRYYVALDGDALKRTKRSRSLPPALRLAVTLKRRRKEVFLVELPYRHDPDSVGDFDERVKASKEFTNRRYLELLASSRA